VTHNVCITAIIRYFFTTKAGLLTIKRPAKIDTFYVVNIDITKVKRFSRSYGPFQFVNIFQTDDLPNDFYFLFYVNPANNDVLQIARSGGGARVGREDGAYLFTRDSVNYIKNLRLY